MEKNEGKFDLLIKKYLGGKESRVSLLPSENCPSELELSDYLEHRLGPQKQDLLLAHLADCSHCLSLLSIAQEAAEQKIQDRPFPEMITRAKNIMQKKPEQTIFRYKWPILASISFTLSFILARYFLQFLILAVIFSLKWIFDTGSTRTLIMIYEAWRKKDKGSAQRIINGFQDKVEQRR